MKPTTSPPISGHQTVTIKRLAPAYPLITHDPYFSIWSFTDIINEEPSRHWSGKEQPLIGLVKVDGKCYRFLGNDTAQFNDVLYQSGKHIVNKITKSNPGDNWETIDYNDEDWKCADIPDEDSGSTTAERKSHDLWLRRHFDLQELDFDQLFLKLKFDEDIELYLNGEEIYHHNGKSKTHLYPEISETAKKNLKKENNVLAIHVWNSAGGKWLDAWIVEQEERRKIVPANQTGIEITATKTSYTFTCGGIDLELSFLSPLLMDDLDFLSRPVSYISVKTKANDGLAHEVQIYVGVSSNIAVNDVEQLVKSESSSTSNLCYLKSGTVEQAVLEKKGDDLRIDWGYLYVAVSKASNVLQKSTSAEEAFNDFLNVSEAGKKESGTNLMLNTIFPKEYVKDEKEHVILVGYDDVYSINYFGNKLRPWWNKHGNNTIENELEAALAKYSTVSHKCSAFDKQLRESGIKYGGENYASLLELGYRQSIAAHKLVESPEGEILFLSKENYSNGSINTVDVTYPSAPLFLIYNPELLKGMLNGIFYYSESGRWQKPFPAHDLGTYPIATGQTYHEDMPVEEAGNMLILTAAIVRAEGDVDYARKHWESLSTWVNYLLEAGFNPENQLSTDDFSGHLAGNANLSVKAIVAIGCYGSLAEELGYSEEAEKYSSIAKAMAKEWMHRADAGDHYALSFNDLNTWSQKYNLVWDKVLNLNIFPQEVYDKELAFYATKINKYGLPLDSRSDYTKSDWILWIAALTETMEDFMKFSDPVYSFALETEDRVPLTDWHYTSKAKMEGFQARSVVGAFYIKFLKEEWKKNRSEKSALQVEKMY